MFMESVWWIVRAALPGMIVREYFLDWNRWSVA